MDFLQSYLGDEVFAETIKFTKQNIKIIVPVFLFFTHIILFYFGKIYGLKTQSVLTALKERYQNIEAQKKRLSRDVNLLNRSVTLITMLLALVFLGECATIGYLISKFGFDYSVIFVKSAELERNIAIVLFVGMISLLALRSVLSKVRQSKRQTLETLHTGLHLLADNLLANLGPELTEVLKTKLHNHK